MTLCYPWCTASPLTPSPSPPSLSISSKWSNHQNGLSHSLSLSLPLLSLFSPSLSPSRPSSHRQLAVSHVNQSERSRLTLSDGFHDVPSPPAVKRLERKLYKNGTKIGQHRENLNTLLLREPFCFIQNNQLHFNLLHRIKKNTMSRSASTPFNPMEKYWFKESLPKKQFTTKDKIHYRRHNSHLKTQFTTKDTNSYRRHISLLKTQFTTKDTNSILKTQFTT